MLLLINCEVHMAEYSDYSLKYRPNEMGPYENLRSEYFPYRANEFQSSCLSTEFYFRTVAYEDQGMLVRTELASVELKKL